MRAKTLAALAVLTAAASILHFVEAQIPLIAAVPGVKPGLANIVTLIAIAMMSPRRGAMVLCARILIGGLFSGQMMSLFYSAAGGALSFATTCVLLKILDDGQIWAVSVGASLAHIAGQLIVARLVLGTGSVFAYAPVLAVSAMITGLFTGICAQTLIARFRRSGFWKDKFSV